MVSGKQDKQNNRKCCLHSLTTAGRDGTLFVSLYAILPHPLHELFQTCFCKLAIDLPADGDNDVMLITSRNKLCRDNKAYISKSCHDLLLLVLLYLLISYICIKSNSSICDYYYYCVKNR